MPHISLRVLIVDDHEQFRSRARALLERIGYEVIGEADDARSAVAECRRLRPDVLLLDVQLPDQDGFWVADQLARSAETPAIVLTSTREAEDLAEQLGRAPAVHFIHKLDLSPASLQAAVGAPG